MNTSQIIQAFLLESFSLVIQNSIFLVNSYSYQESYPYYFSK